MDSIAALAQYKSGTIQDFLDTRGHFERCLGPEYRMLIKPASGSLIGRVKTISCEVLTKPETQGRTTERAVIVMKQYESHVGPGDVVVMGPSTRGAFPAFEWVGGFIASLFHGCGAAGVVTPFIRDIEEIEPLGLAVVAQGTHPAIIRYRVKGVTLGTPVCIGGVEVKTGDIVVSDSDGTVIIPNDEALLTDLVAFLREHAELEKKAWEDRKRGDLVSTVFGRYGAL